MRHAGIFITLVALLAPATAPARTEGHVAQRAFLYEEDASNPKGQRYPGTVVWCLNRTRADDGTDDVEILGKVDIAAHRLKMIMSLRRNVDATLPASHVIELKFSLPADFNGGGISLVPGIMMKSKESAKGAPLMAQAVKVTDGRFMIGLAGAARYRVGNVESLAHREWFDLPLFYKTQRRGILAIEKGISGRQVFLAAFAAWGETAASTSPKSALNPPRCAQGVASRPSNGKQGRPRKA